MLKTHDWNVRIQTARACFEVAAHSSRDLIITSHSSDLVAEDIPCQPLLAFHRPEKGPFPVPGVSEHQHLDLGQRQWDHNRRSPGRLPLNISDSLHPPRVTSGRFHPGGRAEGGEGSDSFAEPCRLFTYKAQDTSCFSQTQVCTSVSVRVHECVGLHMHVPTAVGKKIGSLETQACFCVREIDR